MSESSVSDVELSPSTDSLDTLIGFATEAGRTTVVSQSSSSAGQPASSDNALGSSDSESDAPRPTKVGRAQNGRQGSGEQPAPSSGERTELTEAAAYAATTGPGGGSINPITELLKMLHNMQLSQQAYQEQQQQQQKQQQEIMAIRLLHPQHLDRIWIGQDQYRLPLAPLNEFPEPCCLKMSGRGIERTYNF